MMVGMAVATMVASIADMNIASMQAIRISGRWAMGAVKRYLSWRYAGFLAFLFP
ncbi:hypothetical protein NFX37_13640 [Serratia marcescens]|nr:hypothetical protein NFX37_13640 [Serratia marcescens]